MREDLTHARLKYSDRDDYWVVGNLGGQYFATIRREDIARQLHQDLQEMRDDVLPILNTIEVSGMGMVFQLALEAYERIVQWPRVASPESVKRAVEIASNCAWAGFPQIKPVHVCEFLGRTTVSKVINVRPWDMDDAWCTEQLLYQYARGKYLNTLRVLVPVDLVAEHKRSKINRRRPEL